MNPPEKANKKTKQPFPFIHRLRIQKLDYESKEIDQSFQKYLDRHKTFREENEKSANVVWESYKTDKKALEQKCKSIKKSLQEAHHQPRTNQRYHHKHPPRAPLKSIHHFPNEMNNDKSNDDVGSGAGGGSGRSNIIIDGGNDVIRETKQLMVDNEREMNEIQPPENPFILMKKDFLEKTATILPKDITAKDNSADEEEEQKDNDVDQQDKGNESRWRRQLFKESRDSKMALFGGDIVTEEGVGEDGEIMGNLDLSDDSSISDDVDNKSLMLTFSAANRDLDDTDLDADSISNLELSGKNTTSNRSDFWNDS